MKKEVGIEWNIRFQKFKSLWSLGLRDFVFVIM